MPSQTQRSSFYQHPARTKCVQQFWNNCSIHQARKPCGYLRIIQHEGKNTLCVHSSRCWAHRPSLPGLSVTFPLQPGCGRSLTPLWSVGSGPHRLWDWSWPKEREPEEPWRSSSIVWSGSGSFHADLCHLLHQAWVCCRLTGWHPCFPKSAFFSLSHPCSSAAKLPTFW